MPCSPLESTSVSWTFMPEPKKIMVFFEGDDDRVVLEGLQSIKFLPDHWQIAKRDKDHPGKDGLVHQLLPFVTPVNGVAGSAVVLVDLDNLSHEQCAVWFRNQITKGIQQHEPVPNLEETKSSSGRNAFFVLSSGEHSGHVVLVPVGLAGDEGLMKMAIEKFAMDDHVLRLVGDERIFQAVSEIKEVTHELAMR